MPLLSLYCPTLQLQDAVGDAPASSYILDDMTETLDNKSQTGRPALSTQRGTSVLQQEVYSRTCAASSLEGMEQLNSRQVTAADLDLEKMRLDGALTRMRCRYNDNARQRQHEERTEQLHPQTVSRSVSGAKAKKEQSTWSNVSCVYHSSQKDQVARLAGDFWVLQFNHGTFYKPRTQWNVMVGKNER